MKKILLLSVRQTGLRVFKFWGQISQKNCIFFRSSQPISNSCNVEFFFLLSVRQTGLRVCKFWGQISQRNCPFFRSSQPISNSCNVDSLTVCRPLSNSKHLLSIICADRRILIKWGLPQEELFLFFYTSKHFMTIKMNRSTAKKIDG